MARVAIALVLALTLVLGGCAAGQTLSGTYVLAVQPQDDQEVIEEVIFSGDELTMRTDLVEQTVPYRIEDGQLIMQTAFGDFAFDLEVLDDRLIIDQLEYLKR